MTGSSGISVGLQVGTQPPLSALQAFLLGARAMRLESVMLIDLFQNLFPDVIWDRELTWLAAHRPTTHEFFDYQVLFGYLATRVGRMRLGVGVNTPLASQCAIQGGADGGQFPLAPHQRGV